MRNCMFVNKNIPPLYCLIRFNEVPDSVTLTKHLNNKYINLLIGNSNIEEMQNAECQ